MLSPFLKHSLLAVSAIALLLSVVWAVYEPGWPSAIATISALAVLLATMADPEASRQLEKLSSWRARRVGRPLTRTIKKRYKKKPDQILSFTLDQVPDQQHEVASYPIADSHGSGLIKAIVHRAPRADPYDVVVVEGAIANMTVIDLDSDGRPELVVDTVAGVHTHQVNVFVLNSYNRFQEVHGSPLHADWGPVRIESDRGAKAHRIVILRGAGAAGSNAKPFSYVLNDGVLQTSDPSDE